MNACTDATSNLLDVMDGINKALKQDGITPDVMRVEIRHGRPGEVLGQPRLVTVNRGEKWGYALLEYQGGVYVTNALAEPGTKRWKKAETAVDRLSKRLKRMVEAQDTSKRQIERRAYLCALLEKLDGVHVMHSASWLAVDHTDCRMEVHPESITVGSRSNGIYLTISAAPDVMDVVIIDQVNAVIRGMIEIKETRDRIERELKAKIEGVEPD